MPTFGDYETTGDPLTTTDGSGHFSQIWLARKIDGADGRAYAVKTYAPRHPRRAAASSETELGEDRALEFLEGVKQLKKAQTESGEAGRRLTPIHQFGKSPEGDAAWYVTDFYGEAEPFLPRSLQSYIIRGGRVDGPALRNILHSVVTGCLALQTSRGYSHGNLKSSNVFRVGKSRPLRKTPLQLADSFPAAPIQLGASDPSYSEIGELLQQTMEAQDLRALGLLILQLVEGRLITTDRDYDYPVINSPAWTQLGKDADQWLEVCNRLLDPSLSLERVNFRTLEREFCPSTVNVPMVAAAVALVCVVCFGVFFFGGWRKKHVSFQTQPQSQVKELGGTAEFTAGASGAPPMSYQWRRNGTAIPNATTATLRKSNLVLADAGSYDVVASNKFRSVASRIASLTVNKPASQIVSQPASRTPARAPQPTEFTTQLQAAQAAFDSASADSPTNLVAALKHVNSALALAPADPRALQLKNQIGAAIGVALTDALRKGNEAAAQSNLGEAMRQRSVAAFFKPDDPRLAQLSSNIFKTALFAATNAVEGVTVNLDEAERHWKFLQELEPANEATAHVKSLIEAFDAQISEVAKSDQAVVNGSLKTVADATNLMNALNGTGIFAWRPSDTNATAKLVEQLGQKKVAGMETAFKDATNAVMRGNIQDARNRLEMLKVLDPADPRVATLEGLIISAAAGNTPAAPVNAPAPVIAETHVAQTPSQETARGPTNLFGVDFVWVKGLGAGGSGAYVAVNELSWGNYKALGGRKLTKNWEDLDTIPVSFPTAVSARQFAGTLSGAFAPYGLSARLPTLQEYLTMTGVLTSSRITATDIDDLVAAGERIEENPQLSPSEVAKGTTNRNGLRNVVDNIREWTSDRPNPFGLSYYVPRNKADRPPYNDLNREPAHESIRIEPFGMRLLLEPASRSAR